MRPEEIKEFLSDILPAVDFNSDFLFTELDSLGVTTIMYALSEKYGIVLDAEDATPKNFKNIESITWMVRSKMSMLKKIKQFAASMPDHLAMVCGEESMTYSQFWEAIQKKAEELKAEGLQPHRAYVYRTNQDMGFLVTYCAIHYLDAVAVPVEHSATEDNIKAIRQEVDEFVFPDDVRNTLFTTGTTGKSKGVMLSELSLTSCAENFTVRFPFNPDLLFIISSPMNHIATLFKIHPTISAGGTLYIMENLKDINAFFKVFDLPFKQFAFFMVPASLRILMQYSYEKLSSLADKVSFIETGAAPMASADMEKLCKALPKTLMYFGYGATEFGCGAVYEFSDGRYKEGCIGYPYKNCIIKIMDDGTIAVGGLGIMSGYVNDPETTAKVLYDGMVHTADLGFFDDEGMLHLVGRVGDVINVGGFKVNPTEVENVAILFPGIKDCICVATKHPVIGPVLKLIVAGEKGFQLDKHALAVFIRSKLEAFKVPTVYESVDEIRYMYNGKKDRKSYQEI